MSGTASDLNASAHNIKTVNHKGGHVKISRSGIGWLRQGRDGGGGGGTRSFC